MLLRAAHSYRPSSALPTSRMLRVPDGLNEYLFASVICTLFLIHVIIGLGAPKAEQRI